MTKPDPEQNYPTQRWKSWASTVELLKWELIRLVSKRRIWRAHNDSLKDRPVTDSTAIVHRWLCENYVDSMIVGLRRILDGTKGTLSLIKFLEKIAKKPDDLTFENYLLLWHDFPQRSRLQQARQSYRRFTSNGSDLDPATVREDARRLRSDHKAIIDHANRRIAHWRPDEQGADAQGTTYDELHRAFDDVAEVLNHYLLLLTASTVGNFEAMLPLGFERAFRRMTDSSTGDTGGSRP